MSDYEARRLKNIQENKRVLAELGLIGASSSFNIFPRVIKDQPNLKRKSSDKVLRVSKKQKLSSGPAINNSLTVDHVGRRRSLRVRELKPEYTDNIENYSPLSNKDSDEEEVVRIKAPPNRPNFYGAVSGVEVGTVWETRLECCVAGVHRPTVAGIHGGPDGAYSLALSGGYEDDIDLGSCFTYTGEGGRDLKGTKSNPKNLRTAPQTKDQVLLRGNLALSKNVDTGHPVRLIRGYKLKSAFAPVEGYRYDGLYEVTKFWQTVGLSGHLVFKYALQRCEDQAPPPWTIDDNKEVECSDSETKSDVTHESHSSLSPHASVNTDKQLNSCEHDYNADCDITNHDTDKDLSDAENSQSEFTSIKERKEDVNNN